MDEGSSENGSVPAQTGRNVGFASMTPRVIVGIVLIFFGIDLLIQLATGVDVPTFAAGLGAGFLLFWRTHRGYGWLVAGSILLGVGLGSIFALLVPPVLGESFERLLLGGGFALIAILDSRHRSNWAWIPAVVLGVVAITGLAIDIDRVISPKVAAPLLPALAIVAGALLLFRNRLSTAAFRAALALTVAIGIAVSSVSGVTSAIDDLPRSYSELETFQIPPLAGRTLIVRANGPVEVTEGPESGRAVMHTRDAEAARAKTRLARAEVEVVETDQLVRVSLKGAGVTSDFEISAPRGSDLRIETGRGKVAVEAEGFGEVRISSGSGDVEVIGYPEEVIVRTGSGEVSLRSSQSQGAVSPHSPDVDIATGSGDVVLEISENVALEISSSSGDIRINEEDVSTANGFTRNGSDGSVIVRTGSGDVDVMESVAG